jgi:HEAT repeat protein
MKIRRTICNLSAFVFLCCYTFCPAAFGQQQDEAIEIVLDILKSGDQEMQTVAITMVKDMPGKEVTKALAKELPNLSVTSQVQLLYALGNRGDDAALPAVITAVKAKDESIRIAALKALGQLGNETNVSLLAETAATTKGQEQKAARQSLYRLRGAKVDEMILAGIPNAEAKIKIELISSVGQRDISQGVNALLNAAKDSDRKVRIESIKALKAIATPEHLPELVKLLLDLQSSSENNEAQKTIAAIAHKIEDKNQQAEAVLAVLPSVTDIQKRCSLLSVLGKIGDSSALPSLLQALDNDNIEIRGAAIRALAEWPTAEPLPDLMNIAENSEHKVNQILALRGCVRLLGLDNNRPAEETMELYKKAMALAPNVNEKRRVLSGLGNIQSLDALQTAADYLEDKTLNREAEYAAVKIAKNIFENFPEQTQNVLEKIVRNSKNDSLLQQAQKIINQIQESQN